MYLELKRDIASLSDSLLDLLVVLNILHPVLVILQDQVGDLGPAT